MSHLEVLEFKYIAAEDFCDPDRWPNWSRAYEYAIALDHCIENREGVVIHNTCCGGENPLHRAFVKSLLPFGSVINSDLKPFRMCIAQCDIRKPIPYRADTVLCISALEELQPDEQVEAVKNLWNSVLPDGHLLITADVPGLDLPALEAFVGHPCKDTPSRLSGSTSIFPQHEHSHLNVIRCHLRKG